PPTPSCTTALSLLDALPILYLRGGFLSARAERSPWPSPLPCSYGVIHLESRQGWAQGNAGGPVCRPYEQIRPLQGGRVRAPAPTDRKSTRLNSSHVSNSYAV